MTVIKIKRGPGAPTTSALTSFEPGFSTDNENLYINNAGSMVRIGHKTYTGSSAPDSSLGENGDFYTQLTTSSSSVTTSNDFLQKVDGEWLSVGGGGGGGNTNYLELTQAEYNALTPEEKNNGTIYFVTDAASGGDSGITMEVYSGTLMSPATDGVCTLTKLDAGPCYIYNLVGWFKANGTIPTATEYTPIFQFDTGVIPVNFGVTLAFGESSGFSFCRITSRSASNTVGVFYGTSADKYYNFNQTYFVQKS